MLSRLLIGVFGALLVLSAACEDEARSSDATPTARPVPPPVTVSPEPQGVGLADPAFDALPGATAHHGRLGGSVYQMEMPDRWNGKLVLYMHGFQSLAPEASVEVPGIRHYLIRNGYAWGASSYSSTALIPGRAADETAALWDEFVRRFRVPDRTYVTGISMGGAASHIAAERYAGRFDGSLALCGFAGQQAITQIVGDYFYTGAFVAGVTQQEFENGDVYEIIDQRVKPALQDPAKHAQWMNMLIDMTGGPRALAAEGFSIEEETNWFRAPILVATGQAYNSDYDYQLPNTPGLTDEEFNAGVVRRQPPDPETRENFRRGNELTGDLQMPMLTLHTTGDWQVPIDQQQILRRTVDAAGKGDLLVQRIVRAAEHCGFTEGEWITGLHDLEAWVEEGAKPEGDEVLVDDLSDAGARFTQVPRFGTPEGKEVAGAEERIIIRGNLTVDGAPVGDDAFIWVEVVDEDGNRQICSFPEAAPRDGSYARTVMPDVEFKGCGAAGRSMQLVLATESLILSRESILWPGSGGFEYSLDWSFASGSPRPPFTYLYGSVTNGDGERLPPGTLVEAFVGDVKCGAGAVPQMALLFIEPSLWSVLIDQSRSGCGEGTIRFVVDGTEAEQTATIGSEEQRYDLVVR